MQDLAEVKKELGKEDIDLGNVHFLFLDISSTCTGYAVVEVDFINKSANFTRAGCLWLDNNWHHQEKYNYMATAITNYFWIVEQTDYIVVEQYSINPKKMGGVNVISELQGAIKSAAWENAVKVSSILPQQWRAALGLKKTISAKGQTDWKTPTKNYVNSLVQVPEELVSNITGNLRTSPSDVYDAIGIGLGWLAKNKIDKVTFKGIVFNPHIGYNIK